MDRCRVRCVLAFALCIVAACNQDSVPAQRQYAVDIVLFPRVSTDWGIDLNNDGTTDNQSRCAVCQQ